MGEQQGLCSTCLAIEAGRFDMDTQDAAPTRRRFINWFLGTSIGALLSDKRWARSGSRA